MRFGTSYTYFFLCQNMNNIILCYSTKYKLNYIIYCHIKCVTSNNLVLKSIDVGTIHYQKLKITL